MKNRFILGTVQFGLDYGISNRNGKPSEENVFNILDEAYGRGIRELDTADAYGNASSLIGKYIAQRGDRFLINTKFRYDVQTSIRRQLEKSLNQLRVDHINIYFYHHFEEMLQHPESVSELRELKRQGLIEKAGISVYTNSAFETCINVPHIDVIQLPFNLLDNFSRRGKLLKEAKSKGKEIQARSVFLQGLFFKEDHNFPGYLAPLKKYISLLQEKASERNMSMNDLALAYALKKKEIDSIVLGVDSKEHLQKNTKVASVFIEDELEKEIDKIQVVEEDLLYPYNWK